MQESFFKRHLLVGAIVGILIAVLGIFMMFQGSSFIKVFVVILGVFLIASGIHSLIGLAPYEWGKKSRTATIVKSVVSIGIGVVACILPVAVA